MNAFKGSTTKEKEKENTAQKKGQMPQQGSYGGLTSSRGKGRYTNNKGKSCQIKGKGRGYSSYNSGASLRSYSNTYCIPNPDTTITKERAKMERTKPKDRRYHNNKQINHTKAGTKGKQKRKFTPQGNLCGKMGHTAPSCWWKGQTYAIDQHAPVAELPTIGQQYEISTQPPPPTPAASTSTILGHASA
eukprot:1922973-Amphidinium_carterae.1